MSAQDPTPPIGDQGLIPVLLYHSIAASEERGLPAYNATPDEFARHLDLLQESDRTVVSFRELGQRLRDQSFDERSLAAVTFDDGFADNLKACEVLADRGIPATVFVTSSYVGRPNMLGTSELRELASLPGIEVGAHSVNHPHLDAIPSERARDEIVNGKTQLEDLLGAPVVTFAYPHGAYDRNVRTLVEESGFSAAAAVKNAISHRADDHLAIARWSIETGASPASVREVIAGTGAPQAWSGERLRTRVARMARRSRALFGTQSENGAANS